MHIQYLGTAAAEAIPAVWCHCKTCMQAKANGGKDIRGRSGVVINGVHMIDLPPDIYFTSLRIGLDMGNIKDLFVTHSHSDHFDVQELSMRLNGCFCHIEDKSPLNIYGNDGVKKAFDYGFNREYGEGELKDWKFNQIHFGDHIKTDNLTFTPLKARHKLDEQSMIYLVEEENEDGNKAFLYAHDTGNFFEEVFDALKGKKLDAISFDCTCGRGSDGGGHMGIPNDLEMAKRLREMGCIDDNTVIMINHFSHNCGSVHSDLEEAVKPYGWKVAYDGMKLDI